MRIRTVVNIHNDNYHVTSAKRDTASGVAGLDSTGDSLAPGNAIRLTRDGSNIIDIIERTSGDVAIRLTRKGSLAFAPYVLVGGSQDVMGFMDANGDIPHMRPKAASANLRHSHNAEATTTDPTSPGTVLKTITFSNGISGTLRIKFDQKVNDVAAATTGKIYKNGTTLLGVGQTTSSITYVTTSQDLAVGVLGPGEYLQLIANVTDTYIGSYQNFQIFYDNAADTVLVAGVTTS